MTPDPLSKLTYSQVRAYAISIGGSSITRITRKADLILAIRRYESKLAENAGAHHEPQ